MPKDFESINQAIVERVSASPDDPLLIVPDRQLVLHTFTYRALDNAATLIAHHLNKPDLVPVRQNGDVDSKLVVGLFMQSNFDYIILELALVRLGYCVLLISWVILFVLCVDYS
jgi:acyl-CoA synthetase (AMP-forming)/AMP-acid ligase II